MTKSDSFYMIAEIGVNYYDIASRRGISPMEAAKEMVREAHEAGAHAAKFQSYKAATLAAKQSPAYWDTTKETTTSQYELFQKFDKFGAEEYAELAAYAASLGVDFLSTPFDLDAVEYLDALVPAFKIASADLTNKFLLRAVARKHKPIYMSVGAATIGEIETALTDIYAEDPEAEVVLLHCVLSYPTANADANLNRIDHLQTIFPETEIGYSDHTVPDDGMSVLTATWVMGVRVIEKHFTLDKSLPGNDHYHAMDPDDLRRFCKNIDTLEDAFEKDTPSFLPCENAARLNARRRIVTARPLKAGETITEDALILKRASEGLRPEWLDTILGKAVSRDLEDDTLIQPGDIAWQ